MSSKAPIYLGIDGGGTKTIARRVRFDSDGSATVLATGETAGSNPLSVGWDAAQQNIAAAVERCRGSAEAETQPRAAVLAIAGCAASPAREQMQEWAQQAALAETVRVVPDTTPVLAEADPSSPAIGVIAGTGSSVIAQAAGGDPFQVGGWGYLIDDGGSGYALGREALRTALRAVDRYGVVDVIREPDHRDLTARVLDTLNVSEPQEVKSEVYDADNPRRVIAAISRPLIEAAMAGNAAALRIVGEGAADLAAAIESAVARLGDTERITLFMAGSLLQKSELYRQTVESRCRQTVPRVDRFRMAPDAAVGCARLARRLSR